MSSIGFVRATDAQQRLAALDPKRSFIVQAPAGSGKTELLIQRYLKLLAVVEQPERILAMTFTRKAAAEMRERIIGALTREIAAAPHEQLTHELAVAAMSRSREMGWDLLGNPGRIKVQTIDSLCGSLVAQMPWLARHGALPEVIEDAAPLYMSAAQKTVLMVENPGRHSEWIEHLLLHLDNKTAYATKLIAAMLAKREQWISHAVNLEDDHRAEMEATFQQAAEDCYAAVERLLPIHDIAELRNWFGSWEETVEGLLTAKAEWRKILTKKMPGLFARIEGVAGLPEAIQEIRKLPPPRFTDEQWRTLRALIEVLKLAVGNLRLEFQSSSSVDFSEMTLAAAYALGHTEDPSDLALKLDARIDHLLIDEFQDTSNGQFELTTRLVAGWEHNDGRTIFVVGDPMQSIYRFRQAEVGRFLETVESGIGDVQPAPLVLSANYRSVAGIVTWVNQVFGAVFPALSDPQKGAVTYSPSEATRGDNGPAVELHGFPDQDREQEAAHVVELVSRAHVEDPNGTVAILVRARSHLGDIITALKRAGLSFRAVKIDSLSERQCARDLLSLTRAMLHLGDRVAWLAILRAPWCGLSLADLHALAGSDDRALIYDLIHGDLLHLSEDGQVRLHRLRTTLDEAFHQRGRRPLRVWVEQTWRALGGADCLESSGDVKDASDYFDLLEREQAGNDLPDFDTFAARVEALKAQADPNADERLQVMTIHEAKGLQFDTVILPGLGRLSGSDERSLFLYHDPVMAPIQESGGDSDPIYKYLQEIEKTKSANEVIRQLYVAVTRAKNRLHLMGYVNAHGKPDSRSMLAILWRGLSDEERQVFVDAAHAEPQVENPRKNAALRRLSGNWQAKAPAPPVSWLREENAVGEEREPTFEWVGDNLRHAGTVVHAVLQRIARQRNYRPTPAIIRTSLAQLGVPTTDLPRTALRVEKAIARTLASERGSWILAPHHREARSEMAVAAFVDGRVVRGTIDRTFIDADGARWVIDFKTSAHEGAGLQAFLDEQQRRYRGQLERYGRFFADQGAPVKLGLYFPLLEQWREWDL
jgi:ATP-dependent exoDNAse (exonuclease V) beta subunit